jgi:hypothetical protein
VKPDEDPRVVDLRRYKKAVQAKAARKAAPPLAKSESLLGSRPRAGLLLVLIVVALAALWLGPKLLLLH